MLIIVSNENEGENDSYFRKYTDIDNIKADFIEKINQASESNEKFVVEEKVHGANFSFWITVDSIRVAKRTSLLTTNDDFFNHQLILEKYRSNVRSLFTQLEKWVKNKGFKKLKLVILYGELFGGFYPNFKVKGTKKIGKEIVYSPENNFYAFDLVVIPEDGKWIYLDVTTRNEFLERNGFFFARPLYVGTLEECVNYPKEFQSKIPQWLGLPPAEDNICEGVVIKPLKASFLPNGKRIIIKNKTEKFKEKKKRPKAPAVLSPHLQEILDLIIEYITLNRYENLVSKHGTFSMEDFGKLIALYSKDVYKDFNKEHGEDIERLPKKDRKQITKKVNREITKSLHEWLKEGN